MGLIFFLPRLKCLFSYGRFHVRLCLPPIRVIAEHTELSSICIVILSDDIHNEYVRYINVPHQ